MESSEQLAAPDYPETADIVTSSDQYARRFSGKVGEWFLEVQKNITLRAVQDLPNATVLDVGGGHGQLAIPLCQAGYKVTVLGSADSCRHRIRGIVDSGKCSFQVGNVIDLPFKDRSFDVAISFRLLTHCSRWPALVQELCRVAKKAVVVDYPTNQSLNRIAPALFGAKKKMEGDTRTWSLFRHQEVTDAFTKNHFLRTQRHGQFFLPMVLHRMLRCRPLSALLEGLSACTGLTFLWGTPVIARFDRRRAD